MKDNWIRYLMNHDEAWNKYNIRHVIERLSVIPKEQTLEDIFFDATKGGKHE